MSTFYEEKENALAPRVFDFCARLHLILQQLERPIEKKR